MTNLELRILSGLHRGAALPLDTAALELGGAEHCDVVLADRGLAARHARLAPGMDGWRLEALDGEVAGEFDPAPVDGLVLAAGACARLGEVWICLSAPDAPWQAAPEPAPVAPPEPARPAAAAAAPVRPRTASRIKRLVLLPFGMVIVLCAATAYAFTARPESPTPAPAPSVQVPLKRPAVSTPQAEVLTGAALRAAFERELADAQVRERFELALGETRWDMRADLDEEEKERFERMLGRFIAAHRIGFPVEASIVPSAALLPFRIEQVIKGAQGGIVTADGHRLFVGDEYRGTRLISMKDGRLVFAGKRKIEVQW